jgi:hypothetical protein|tara:strand:- start:1804 stop:2457 length:654 start_codon:yes stop_codon:yes gene_type:complete
MQGRAARRAADAQVRSTEEASRVQREMFDRQVQLQEPFRQGGITGQNRIMELLGIGGDASAGDYGRYGRDFSMNDFEADPGYAFRLSEGNKALERSAASRGMLLSGSMFKGTQRFGQDLASQEYANAFNRYQTNRSNQLNPLQSLMGAGQTATNQLAGAAGQLGGQLGENALGAGNARASGYVGQANAYTNAINGVSNAFGSYMGARAPGLTPKVGG